MILADSSVWIDHLRRGDPKLITHLQADQVCIHPHIIGELALGSLRERKKILGLLNNLPKATVATDAEVMTLIENRQLFSRGIGFVDCHLIASTLLSNGVQFWTRDKRLAAIAQELEIGLAE